MNKKIFLSILLALISIALLTGIIYGEVKTVIIVSPLCALFIPYCINLMIKFFQDAYDIETWQKSLRKHIRGRIIKKNDYIRISFAYLFRIKVLGKYLLVKSQRGTEYYQPVGGVYKCKKKEKEFLYSQFRVNDDECIPIDESSENDYRMRVPANVIHKFIKRFDQTYDREKISDLSREFKEELINNKILNEDCFTSIEYRYCGRHFTEIRHSRYFDCYELLLADIVELIVSDEQEKELIGLQKKKSTHYYWATEDEIKACGIKVGSNKLKQNIADHSEKILICESNKLLLDDSNKENYIITII